MKLAWHARSPLPPRRLLLLRSLSRRRRQVGRWSKVMKMNRAEAEVSSPHPQPTKLATITITIAAVAVFRLTATGCTRKVYPQPRN